MTEEAAIEMFVGGLVLDPNTQAPIVILKDESGKICLPIWIGIAEATSIATVLKGVALARPMTHDLMFEFLRQFGAEISRACIIDLKDSTYFAELIITIGDRAIVLDARPSDAIALALRNNAPIFVAQSVLDQARVSFGTEFQPEDSSSAEGEGADKQSPEPLETNSEDKDFKHIEKNKWSQILAELDPKDFKHKM